MRAPRQQSSLSAIKYFIFIYLHVSTRLPAIPRERGLLSDFTLLCVIFLQCQHGCTSCDTPIESCNKQFFARTCTLLTYTRSWLAPISRKNHYLEDNIKQCSSLKMLLYFHFPRRLDSRSSNQHNFLGFFSSPLICQEFKFPFARGCCSLLFLRAYSLISILYPQRATFKPRLCADKTTLFNGP